MTSSATRERRNAQIKTLRRAGATHQEIADRFGITRQRVEQIAKGIGPDLAERRRVTAVAREERVEALTDEIVECYRGGRNVPEVAAALKLRPQEVSAVVNRVVPEIERRRKLVGATSRWSDADLVETLRAAAEKNGGEVLTVAAYSTWADGTDAPAVPTIIWRFGTWGAALSAAGLPVNAHGGKSKQFTTEACVAAVARVWDELGRPPTFRSYDQARRRGDPSPETVRLRFGRSWLAVLDAAAEVRR